VADANLPLEGRTVWMVRAAGTPVLVGERLGEGGQGIVHAAQIGGASCAVKWYRAVPKPKELRDSITALLDSGCPHPAFIWPIDLVASITSHHLHRNRNHETVIGMVEAHPTKPGEVVLRNVGPDQRRLGTA
jgi:hypothetical protein